MTAAAGTAGKSTWESYPGQVRGLVYLLSALAIAGIYSLAHTLIAGLFGVVLLFVFASVLALVLTPLIDRLQSLGFFRNHRHLAVFGIYGATLVVIVGGSVLVLPILSAQLGVIGRQMPQTIADLQVSLDHVQQSLHTLGLDVELKIPKPGAATAGTAFTLANVVLQAAIALLLVLVISIYLSIQGRELLIALRKIFPNHERLFDFSTLTIGTTISAYVRGQLILSTLMAVYTGTALTLIGVHYAIPLAALVFGLELLPLIGAPIGMGVEVLVALFQGPRYAVFAGLVGIGGHVIEAYIVGPRVIGKVTRLHPLVAMGALLVGADLGGILGALFAIPIAGILNIFLGALYRVRQGNDGMAAVEVEGPVDVAQLPTLGGEISESGDQGPPLREAVDSSPSPRRAKAPPPAKPARKRRASVPRAG